MFHHIGQDLLVVLMPETVRQFEAQFLHFSEHGIAEQRLHDSLRWAYQIAREQCAPLAMRFACPVVPALAIGAIALARHGVGTIERDDDTAERDTTVAGLSLENFQLPKLGFEEIVCTFPRSHVADQEIETVAPCPFG